MTSFDVEVLSSYTQLSLEEMQNSKDLLINCFDKDLTIVFWNNKAEEFFQIPKEKAIGKKLDDLLPGVKKDDRFQLLSRALKGQEMHILKDRHRNNSGGYYEQKVVPVKDDKGNVIAALNIVRDL